MSSVDTHEVAAPGSWTNWTKRLGFAAFLFFAVKGLLWLAAPLVFYWLI